MTDVPHIGISPEVLEDLKRSGLEPKHMNIRALGTPELAAVRLPTQRAHVGYVIPYFNMYGEALPFYRVRLLNPAPGDPKYKQPQGVGNHIYFPPGFLKALESTNAQFVIITEGEKKAAAAQKCGFPCVAVAGVESWKTRLLILPEDTQLVQAQGSKAIQAKIPAGMDNPVQVQDTGPLAAGLQDLIDLCVKRKMDVIIVYDTDVSGGVRSEVQKAAAKLGYELRYRGLPIKNIRQLILPTVKGLPKVGLDDYLVKEGITNFATLVRSVRQRRMAFPRHPNPKVLVATKLQKHKLSRKESQDVALAVLMELEARGRRLRVEQTDMLHYFDEQTRTLMKVIFNPKVPLHETTFGGFLYQEFNLGGNDRRVIEWLATLYSGEPTVFPTVTHKVIARPTDIPNAIAYQSSDTHYVIVTGDPDNPFTICENGTHGILFEQGQTEPCNEQDLETEFYRWVDDDRCLWGEVLEQLNFRAPESIEGLPHATSDQLAQIISLLFYISPWLARWNGTQVPVEIVIGEAGSGKSSLYTLRQRIVTGYPRLSNMTHDIRDWYAGITSRGGVHVLDNVHFTASGKDVRQRMSDEICRLVTDPEPHVELRKLYTTNDSISLPVNATFAVTAIEQPFYNVDIIQRSAIFELHSISANHDAQWVKHQLDLAGGRVGWVAHQLAFIHKFLHLGIHEKGWDYKYKANHRLANYEQSLRMAARVFKLEHDWIPSVLAHSETERMSEADWVLQGIKDYIETQRKKTEYWLQKHTAQMISEWAEQHGVYYKNGIMINSNRLGRYMSTHKQILSQLGLNEQGKLFNRMAYVIARLD